MTSMGRHLLIDMYGCNYEQLIHLEMLKSTILTAISEANLTLQDIVIYPVEPQGLALFALLGDSHINIQTYPELNYAAVDIFTCTDSTRPDKALSILKKFFKPEKMKTTKIMRGDFGSQKDMKPRSRVSIAPLRRVRNTSARVWRFLRNK